MAFVRNVPRAALLALAQAILPAFAAAGPPALDPPPPDAVAEARTIVEAMRSAERGPYLRLRWFCADGAVLPPTPSACRDHGGGRQHGEYSPERQRLAELGWPVGTILAATSWEEFWDGERRQLRLQQLLVERYLVAVDDGWVMRRARLYRGHVQAEDEEQAGRDLLVRLLAVPAWASESFLLAREAVRTLPHHSGSDRTQTIRHLSQEIADKDRSFESLRIKIHTAPGAADVAAVRDWAASARRRGADQALIASAEQLAATMEALYGSGDGWLTPARKALARDPRWQELEPLLQAVLGETGTARLAPLGSALVRVRELVPGSADGARNLALVDLSLALERELVRHAFETLDQDQLPRAELLRLAGWLLDGTYGAGLLSARERDATAGPVARLIAAEVPEAGAYAAALLGLRRVPGWCQGTVRHAFAEALISFGALEPKALRYSDDILRGSALLPLAEVIASLTADGDQLAGVSHRLFGQRVGGVVGLNPGLARGRLRVMTVAELTADVSPARDEIVVLPRTVSDLAPVAGILTLAEGNLLSHVQLLARNLGIPNATIAPTLAAALAAHSGREVLLAVGSDGSVLVEEVAQLSPQARASAGVADRVGMTTARVDAPTPDLSLRRPIPLAELSAGMAGRVVGPKAANLGELARHFPGRVEQAIALPFGVFADHVAHGPDSPKARLDRAYARHRAGALDEAGLAFEIAEVCQAVADTHLSARFRAQLEAMMRELFGEPTSYGVFIRSDTNVEDLPGFTGAGLNETIANVVDPAEQRRAIARVWASPYRERAVAWRAPLLTRPEEVYTSVLIMKSVPAEKSGVMVTTDLVRRRRGLTVAMSWGVGGAVNGEAAETLVLAPDGSELLVGEAKAPYQRRLRPEGGVEWIPAPAGAVLSEAERRQLRALAREIGGRLEPQRGADDTPLPWDVELGFVAGRVQLFQIRPLVEHGSAQADRAVAALNPGTTADAGTVRLDAPVPLRSVPMVPSTR